MQTLPLDALESADKALVAADLPLHFEPLP
jgi:hypothetical protein